MNEQEMIDRIGRGDMEALAQFMVARKPQLLAYIQRQSSDALRRKIEVEDLSHTYAREENARSLDWLGAELEPC